MQRLIRYIKISPLLLLLGLLGLPSHARAFTNSRMIDDQVFNNTGAMNTTAIQNFLNGFPNSCVKNYQSIIPIDWTTYGGNTSTANIFTWSANHWGINPQVLIATMQKEEQLIDGSQGCDGWRYVSAMGYDCPGSLTSYPPGNYPSGNANGTSPSYPSGITSTCVQHGTAIGVSAQISHAGWNLEFGLQRAYGNTAWDGDDTVTYYGPMTQGYRKRCGTCSNIYYDGYNTINGQNIYIENGATASLYNYTPFLNQSFPGIFTSYFGSTYSAGGTSNISWMFEALDGGGNSPISGYTGSTGQTPNAITFNSVLHVFSYDAGQKDLRHSYADNSGWHTEVLDGAGGSGGRISGDVGIGTTSVVYNSKLHIFYYDQGNGDLRHATYDGATWTFETLDGAGGSSGQLNANLGYHPTVTAFGTGLQIFYYDATNGNLRHAWINTSSDSWHFEDLDGSSTSVSGANGSIGSNPTSTAFGSTVQVFYYDNLNGNLRHAWSDSIGWHFENLDGTANSVGHSDADLGMYSSAISYNSTLQVFYYDRSHGNLRHGWSDAGGWHFENLDGDPGSIGHNDSEIGQVPVTLNFQNILYVFYYDGTLADLRHAYSDSGGWHFGDLDGSNFALSLRSSNPGPDSAATEYPAGTLQLYYYDAAEHSLRHAWGSLK